MVKLRVGAHLCVRPGSFVVVKLLIDFQFTIPARLCKHTSATLRFNRGVYFAMRVLLLNLQDNFGLFRADNECFAAVVDTFRDDYYIWAACG